MMCPLSVRWRTRSAAWPATRRLEAARSSHAVVGGGRARARSRRYTGRVIASGGRLQLPTAARRRRFPARHLPASGWRARLPNRSKSLGPPALGPQPPPRGRRLIAGPCEGLYGPPTLLQLLHLCGLCPRTIVLIPVPLPQRLIHRIVTFKALHALDPLQNRIRLLSHARRSGIDCARAESQGCTTTTFKQNTESGLLPTASVAMSISNVYTSAVNSERCRQRNHLSRYVYDSGQICRYHDAAERRLSPSRSRTVTDVHRRPIAAPPCLQIESNGRIGIGLLAAGALPSTINCPGRRFQRGLRSTSESGAAILRDGTFDSEKT
ncbi:hypothetical protein TcasGA2_TC016052 [Tribolium castaneum]|uniref:Uncharacterized protein n=1 Tax=Tribolium castaneum TaxID=7070 RepID=D6W6T5_TRICA|nr:hypothetical protein TcasGA2_TC016052 [Tribolium castaneum]